MERLLSLFDLISFDLIYFFSSSLFALFRLLLYALELPAGAAKLVSKVYVMQPSDRMEYQTALSQEPIHAFGEESTKNWFSKFREPCI